MNHKLDANKILTHLPKDLELALDAWRNSAQKKLVYFLVDNQGEVTHKIMPVIWANNMSATANSTDKKLNPLGYEIVCISLKGRTNQSWRWYLCEL